MLHLNHSKIKLKKLELFIEKYFEDKKLTKSQNNFWEWILGNNIEVALIENKKNGLDQQALVKPIVLSFRYFQDIVFGWISSWLGFKVAFTDMQSSPLLSDIDYVETGGGKIISQIRDPAKGTE